ncbi:dihydroneopterin aldolase [Texcoconibacillus texcoconensis]|uniref:7,8-dihydroneopterin aldolase n=1 Tax=Texcoconibacillus texcoconensis TaxID=1095777 RepID=A0A840QU58_9BACI|nr:dihydroneopterin aldolase [Texcoconibacillus texcoconensis]MBB5174880.1 dihydroneopterin aldolase [Texcoconibacillus texcoconensis]
MDKIFVNQMSFYGYHGVYQQENELGQRFYADVILYTDVQPAGVTDDLNKTVNYADVYEQTKNVLEGSPVNLVETLCESIANNLLAHFPQVQACTVKVTKPNPPIPGEYDSVAVEIYRSREH